MRRVVRRCRSAASKSGVHDRAARVALGGVGRDGKPHRRLCLDGMEQEHEFFATDRTRARADLRVNGHPGRRPRPSQRRRGLRPVRAVPGTRENADTAERPMPGPALHRQYRPQRRNAISGRRGCRAELALPLAQRHRADARRTSHERLEGSQAEPTVTAGARTAARRVPPSRHRAVKMAGGCSTGNWSGGLGCG